MRFSGVVFVVCCLASLCVGGVVPPAEEKELTAPTYDVKPVGKMPVVGLGTWLSKDTDLENALDAALEAGYRHIDTAYVYQNEEAIGRTLKKWFDSGKLKREDLFILSKLPACGNRPSGVKKYIQRSLTALQLDYLDMYLIHMPYGYVDCSDENPYSDENLALDKTTDHLAIWKAMEEQVDAGKAKAIGVSNFNISQVTRVLENARIKPANLQIELHAYHQQVPVVEFAKKHDIIVTAYSPLGSPGLDQLIDDPNKKSSRPKLIDHPVVANIAKKHNKSAAQILLRHAIQKGIVVIPKSTNPGRIRQNLDVFDFELDADDMAEMNKLDEKSSVWDSFDSPGLLEHPEYPFQS